MSAAEPQRAAGSARLAFADGIRGLAALWVVLFHASEGGHLAHLKAVLPLWLARLLFDWGHLGIAIFFVLSGFVMMHSVRHYAFTLQFGGRFMARRLLRLTPPYYASILFVVTYVAGKALAQGQPAALPTLGVTMAHASYLQDILALPTLSVVYWTLCIEIQFYIAFTLAMLAQRRLGLRIGGASALPVVLTLSALAGLPWAFGIVDLPLYPGGFLSFWYCFMLGVLVSARSVDRRLNLLLTVYLLLLVAAGALTGSGVVWASLAATALMLTGDRIALLERVLTSRALQFLGLVSYSLYLTHNQVSGAVAFVMKRFVPANAGGELGLLIAMIAACLVVAYLGYRLVERPSIVWSRGVALRRAGLDVAAVAGERL